MALSLSRYYEMLDGWIGEVREAVHPGGYLLVVSAYGSEPLSGLRRAARRIAGLPDQWGGHDAGPAGVLLLSGPGVMEGRQVDDLRVIDVLPLSLYLLGLPVGRDMEGRLPRRLLSRPFLEANPITLISSYG
jgi:predicted AlkP superfamily phosphohydrolase/phosphomutase